MAILRVISGPAAGKEVSLAGSLTIGRGEDCGLRLVDKQISRRHAVVEIAGERILLRDLGSANGTWVGGLRISEVPLLDGGRFQVGANEIALVAHPEIDVAAAAPAVLPDIPTKPAPFEEESGDAKTVKSSLELLQGEPVFQMIRPVGAAPKFHAAVGLALKAAPYPSPVLIRGPSGAGKELVARLIHEQSPRAHRPFLSVNCAAIPAGMQDRELFGYAQGAFPAATQAKNGYFDLAGGGTLFFEEVDELTLATQIKVLHAIEHGEIFPQGHAKPSPVDVRILAASNRNLAAQADSGRFHQELFKRLAATQIELPPLTERPGDVRLLTQYFLSRREADTGQPAPSLSEPALAALERYAWPGNVRELRAVIERVLAALNKPQLDLADLPPEIKKGNA